ncbi:MAG: hypothetical protein NTU73_13430, partial [Ignavibacteriae bacterium]|nr:hypothetical protein [Ignavibacteriota bacterium]
MKKNLLLLLALFVCSSLFAQNKPEFKQEVKIGGVVFTGWTFNMDNSDFITKLDTSATGVNPSAPFGYNPTKNQFETSRNSFYFDRAYINIKASLTPQITARLTPDVYSYTDAANKTTYFTQMKYGYFDYMPLNTDDGLALSFSVGLIPNQWINNVEKYYGYRGVAKTFTDYSWTTSAVRSTNTVKVGTGSFILNGNGFRNEGFDQNRFKDVMVTGFIYPLAEQIAKRTDAMKKANKKRLDGIVDLTLGGFIYMGKLSNNEYNVVNGGQYKNTRFGGMLNLKYNFDKAGSIKIGGEYSAYSNQYPSPVSSPTTDSTLNGGGLSAFLEFNPPIKKLNDKLFLTFRYDMFNPNTNSGSTTTFYDMGKQKLMIIGLMYKPANLLTLGLSYHNIGYDQNYIVKYDG